MNQYTTGEYLHKNPSWHAEDSPWKADFIRQILSRNHIDDIRSLCEVGCGTGEILLQLCPHFSKHTELTGYDISPIAIERARKHENEKLRFHCGDAFTDNKNYDLALCIDVIEHIEDYFGFLRKLCGKARNHIFHVPLEMNVQAIQKKEPLLKARERVGHIHYFMKDTFLAALRETGYEPIDMCYTLQGATEATWKAAALRKLIYRANPDLAARLFLGYSLMVLTKQSSSHRE